MQKMKLTAVIILIVVVMSVVQANYCPMMSLDRCFRSSNKCCQDSDCEEGKICCQEFCGNTCQSPADEESDGKRVEPSSTCRIDPY
ncbi:hypothetical protein NPIL_628871 [Nephila pilipes]|uniref:WAP domain-containing protein n=1 Tax=Nephila pilipes TaxID=299642 RepID=A0A8X6UJA4_NEPPI|nr:hypothetical protein NPIL_628871 [Nephila pilipes]